jgi:chromosome segregation ATPase
VKRGVQAVVAEESKNAEQDLTNLERELAKPTVKWTQMKDAVERRVLQRGQAALGRPETKDRTSLAEPHVAGLRTAGAHGSAKVEAVQQEVAGLKAELSDCCPKVKKDLTNPEQELAKLKKGMREFRVL